MEILIIILLLIMTILSISNKHKRIKESDKWHIMEKYLSECNKIRYREKYIKDYEQNQNKRSMAKYT